MLMREFGGIFPELLSQKSGVAKLLYLPNGSSSRASEPEPKNLVICCDGTGNEISENISNVLKLYRCLRKTDKPSLRQMVPYDSLGRHRSATRKHPPRPLTSH